MKTAPLRRVVVVSDGGQVALTVAGWLLARGAEVHLVTVDERLQDSPADLGSIARLLATGRLVVHPDRSVAQVQNGDVVLTKAGAIGDLFAEPVRAVDAIVMCDQRRPRNELARRLRDCAPVLEVHEIGDCQWPRTALEAIYEGAVAGRVV